MRVRVLALLLALASLAPVAHALTGPFAGVLREGDSGSHAYSNRSLTYPPCVDYVQPIWWTVQVTHAPQDAVLRVEVAGRAAATVTGGNGYVVFQGGGCESFTITVTALDAPVPVAYAVQVRSGAAAEA